MSVEATGEMYQRVRNGAGANGEGRGTLPVDFRPGPRARSKYLRIGTEGGQVTEKMLPPCQRAIDGVGVGGGLTVIVLVQYVK